MVDAYKHTTISFVKVLFPDFHSQNSWRQYGDKIDLVFRFLCTGVRTSISSTGSNIHHSDGFFKKRIFRDALQCFRIQ